MAIEHEYWACSNPSACPRHSQSLTAALAKVTRAMVEEGKKRTMIVIDPAVLNIKHELSRFEFKSPHTGYHNPSQDHLPMALDYSIRDIQATMGMYRLGSSEYERAMHRQMYGEMSPTVDEVKDFVEKRLTGNNAQTNTNNGVQEGKTMRRKDVILSEIARLQEELAMYNRFPTDKFADSTIISFERVFGLSWDEAKDVDFAGTEVYKYAGIKAAGKWHLTGDRAPQKQSWDELICWLNDGVGKMTNMSTGEVIFDANANEDAEAGRQVGLSEEDADGPLGANDPQEQ